MPSGSKAVLGWVPPVVNVDLVETPALDRMPISGHSPGPAIDPESPVGESVSLYRSGRFNSLHITVSLAPVSVSIRSVRPSSAIHT